MKTSQLHCPTLKEKPKEAEIISHQLMLKAGLIRQLAQGIYTWLPLGLRVMQKIEAIVRQELNAIGAQEILMPSIQPAELWHLSGRWPCYGAQLLKINDRHNREYCYGPTHEEVITQLMRQELASYKQLPVCFYQIQTKFRDEIRPRFGVMRAREFCMKDAYSFHLSRECLAQSYQQVSQAYSRIFARLGLDVRIVWADSGDIGGNNSQEFHVLAQSGEDEILYTVNGDYAANTEKATTIEPVYSGNLPNKDIVSVDANAQNSTEEQAKLLNLPLSSIVKTLLVVGKQPQYPIVALIIRADHEINQCKIAQSEWIATPLQKVSVDQLSCEPGFVGPVALEYPLVVDSWAHAMPAFACGSNKNNILLNNVQWQRDCAAPVEVKDFRQIKAGDLAPCGTKVLQSARGIEVGHIFQVGDKYSQSMSLNIEDGKGNNIPVLMGCYGIGVSRLVAAAIEQRHDANGIIWPTAIAPFKVIILAFGYHKQTQIKELADQLYSICQSNNIEVLLNDSNSGPGAQLKDADLWGIPHRVVISNKTLELQPKCYEYSQRHNSQTLHLTKDELIQLLSIA